MSSTLETAGPLRIGVLGARSWIANQAVIPAIAASDRCELVAVGSHGGPVPDHLAPLDTGGYVGVLARDDVEAVYVPLANHDHRRWVEAAADAGKHVLCEKPLGVDAADAAAMVDACRRAGVLLAEAWMTPFGARWAEVVALAGGGGLGTVRHLHGTFTFPLDATQPNYRWEPTQGGGALLDVGIYVLGAAVALWGAEPIEVHAARQLGPSGVDLTTSLWCSWGEGRTASAVVSFELPECQRLEVVGTAGRVVVEGPAFTGGEQATGYQRFAPDGSATLVTVADDAPYRSMMDAFADAVRGVRPWPRPAPEAVAMAALLDRIRAAAP